MIWQPCVHHRSYVVCANQNFDIFMTNTFLTSKACSFDISRTLSFTIRSWFRVNIKILIFLLEILFWVRMDYLVYNQTYIRCENRDFHRFIEDVPFTWYKKANKRIHFSPYQFSFSPENEINLWRIIPLSVTLEQKLRDFLLIGQSRQPIRFRTCFPPYILWSTL